MIPKQKRIRWILLFTAAFTLAAVVLSVLPVGNEAQCFPPEQPPGCSEEYTEPSEDGTPTSATESENGAEDFPVSDLPSTPPQLSHEPEPPFYLPAPLPSEEPDEPSVSVEPPASEEPPVSLEPPVSEEPLPSDEPIGSDLPDDTEEDGAKDFYITVYNAEKDCNEVMLFEEFVTLALSAEMDSKAPMEALKAQAVAIRSFLIANKNSHTGDVMVCNDGGHCMAAHSKDYFNSMSDAYRKKYIEAVESTKGQILTYQGEVAKTYFHWASYGRTESALDVFGLDIPYLVSVPTATDVEFLQNQSFTAEKLLKSLFGSSKAKELLADESLLPLGAIEFTSGGRVKTVEIYGETVTGKKLRLELGLRSTDMQIGYSPTNGTFTFTVYGAGHGVGLSQEGAENLAREGYDYSAILYHYYSGTVLATASEEHFK